MDNVFLVRQKLAFDFQNELQARVGCGFDIAVEPVSSHVWEVGIKRKVEDIGTAIRVAYIACLDKNSFGMICDTIIEKYIPDLRDEEIH